MPLTAPSVKTSELLAIVSHEIRTPMNCILGFARLLADDPLSALERDYIQTIITTTEATLRL